MFAGIIVIRQQSLQGLASKWLSIAITYNLNLKFLENLIKKLRINPHNWKLCKKQKKRVDMNKVIANCSSTSGIKISLDVEI